MSILSTLLQKHQSLLPQAQIEAVKENCRRSAMVSEFVHPADMTDIEARSAFIVFEREFSKQPIDLFGQDVPSLAHTVIRVFRARKANNSNELSPAEEIFSARISEKSMTEWLLSQGRGDGGAPITVTRLGDLAFEPPQKSETEVSRALKTQLQDRQNTLDVRIADVNDILVPELTKPNAQLRDAISSLSYNARDVMNGSFLVERHFENMSQVRNQILTEAAHAALHSDKIAATLNPDLKALPSPQPQDWNQLAGEHPLVHRTLDLMPDDLRAGINTLITAEILELSKTQPKLLNCLEVVDGGDDVWLGSHRDLSQFVDTDTKKYARHLAEIWNWACNTHIDKSRIHYAADQAGMGLSRRTGDTRHIHSSLPAMEQDYFSITISPAYISGRSSTRIQSASSQTLELEIVSQDLMTAVRGHPTGAPTPCSIRSIAGTYIKPVEMPPHDIAVNIKDVDRRIHASPQATATTEALQKLETVAHAKRSGKAWRKELDDALDDFHRAMEDLTKRASEEVNAGNREVTSFTSTMAKKMLSEISSKLPAEVLEILGLPKE